jgi:hypothetical protein
LATSTGRPASGAATFPFVERRKERRALLRQRIGVRPSELVANPFADSPLTFNISRSGIYFVTTRDRYARGQGVVVSFTFGDRRGPAVEYVGRVLRVEQREKRRWGVAVRLLSTFNLVRGERFHQCRA